MSAVVGLGLLVPAAQADFSITGFGGSVDQGGAFSRQAGAHIDLTTQIKFPVLTGGVEDENARSVDVVLPPGIVGNPTAAPACTAEEFGVREEINETRCPPASQIGTARIEVSTGVEELRLYNAVPPPNAPALFAFKFLGIVVPITPNVQPSDGGYVISTHVGPISQALGLLGTKVVLWGVPADRNLAGGRRQPFMSAATSCPAGAQKTSATATSWQHPEAEASASFDADLDGVPFVNERCDKLPFDPSIDVQPSSRVAGEPTGLSVDVTVPQNESPDGLATAHVRKTVITFPRGMSVSASAAAGQGACAPAQIGLGSNQAPSCPPSSNIGSVELRTPLLDKPLRGDVILAKQNDNPFGSLLAIYLAIKGPGFYIKLPGKIDADPVTGQLTATFSDTPQLPFESLHVTMRGGSGAPLLAPATCGTYATKAEVTSWANPVPVSVSSPMTIDQGCATAGFSPKLRAGTANPLGGSFSPFVLQVTREDGEQNIARLDATLPEGLLAKLAGVPLCGDVQAATGGCPAASQVGTTTVGVGAGSSPIYVPEAGKAPTAVYLGGPYKGAPYSLVVKVPAQAGPFDLGTVTVRNGLNIDPVTTQVTASSDPLPQILQGIPISYRDVRVEVSRPGFTLNPTSCDPMAVEATIASAEGKTASTSARFQASACGELGFAPKLALSLSGPTHRSAHPKLRAVLTARKGDANIGRAQVTLPKTEFLENAHIQTICTRVQFAADNCPAKSVYGYAKAWSPLLDKPLQGPVYLRSSSHELPDLVASLDGQIHVDLQGRIDSIKARIRNTFDFVPDAPVSKFMLTMQGGKKGLLVNNTELCKAVPRAEVAFDGQNGKTADASPLVKTDCGKGRKGKKK